jgi:hypothetical protein
MQFNKVIWIAENAAKADKSALGTIMHMNEIIRTWKNPARADKAAVGSINRPLQGAGVGYSMAQSAPKDVRVILFICIIGPYALAIAALGFHRQFATCIL